MRMAEQRAALSTRQFFIPHSDFSLPPSSNPFRGSLPLHPTISPDGLKEWCRFQTPFEDHCHFIPAEQPIVMPPMDLFQTPFEDHCHFIRPLRRLRSRVVTRFQTPFEDHCHFITLSPVAAARTRVRFKPLSRITATSSVGADGLQQLGDIVSNPFRGSLPLHLGVDR